MCKYCDKTYVNNATKMQQHLPKKILKAQNMQQRGVTLQGEMNLFELYHSQIPSHQLLVPLASEDYLIDG